MIKTNYANAYKEVLVILDNLTRDDYNKIPKEYIDFLKANCNEAYKFYYDKLKTFEEQELLDDTKYILFGLFEKFGATELQQEKIKAFRNSYYNQLEQEKREKYNMYDIFKNMEKPETTNVKVQKNSTNTALVEYNKSFWVRLKKFIFKILYINRHN